MANLKNYADFPSVRPLNLPLWPSSYYWMKLLSSSYLCLYKCQLDETRYANLPWCITARGDIIFTCLTIDLVVIFDAKSRMKVLSRQYFAFDEICYTSPHLTLACPIVVTIFRVRPTFDIDKIFHIWGIFYYFSLKLTWWTASIVFSQGYWQG